MIAQSQAMTVLITTLLLTPILGAQMPAPATPEVRVGVVAFEDFHGALEQTQKVLRELAVKEESIQFRLAAGTYGDVLHWLRHGMIDVAIVTPGLCAQLLFPDGSAVQISPEARFLASVGKPPLNNSAWAAPDRLQSGYGDHYHAVCAVSTRSSLHTTDDLRKALDAGKIRFLCVHPASISSRIAPAYALKQLGISMNAAPIEYTHSHTAALRMVVASDRNDCENVAFVWDDALRPAPELTSQVRQLRFPELDQLDIPSEAVVCRADFNLADRLQALLEEHIDGNGQHDFLTTAARRQAYASVGYWQKSTGMAESDLQNVSLEDIGRLLVHHARSQPSPARLALVLSGGGAKCAYQVGAVAAVEEHLERLRRNEPDVAPDIDLVVGTSGGAINALPIALGVTRTDEGRRDFLETWSQFDQRRIVRPTRVVRGFIGLWFALLQAAAVLWLTRWIVRRREMRGWVFGGIFFALAAVEIFLRFVDLPPWHWLGMNHWLHHAWLWTSFGIGASAWSMLLFGLAALFQQWRLARRGAFLTIAGRPAARLLAAGILALPFVQIATVLFFQETLSGDEGIERELAAHFPRLVSRHVERAGAKPLVLPVAHDRTLTLHGTSRQLHERRLLSRDLVLTGSCLEQSTSALPSDLYFFAAGRSDRLPPFGARGIDLAAHPGLWLDVVLGSGSIFPVFPPRRLADFPKPGEYVDLVDGGFAHNSPIEAAVLWGATHVILIEATPRERIVRRNFLQNAEASFDHLYEQSQLLDARSRGKVSVFTLAPEPPHLCVLDFAENLIRAAAERGYRDATGGSLHGLSGSQPRFRKEPGEPLFVEAAPMPGR